jgi:hypothetical protein
MVNMGEKRNSLLMNDIIYLACSMRCFLKKYRRIWEGLQRREGLLPTKKLGGKAASAVVSVQKFCQDLAG